MAGIRMLAGYKMPLLFLAILLVASPLFGVIGAELVGYHEPLDIAAELLGLSEADYVPEWSPFPDYTVPGLPDTIGYIVAGAVGASIILAIGLLAAWATGVDRAPRPADESR